MRKHTKKALGLLAGLCLLAGSAAVPGRALADDPPPQVIFTNVNVFDGVSAERIENASVLVEGNLIKQVSTSSISAEGATVIDGGGKTLMPGLSDTHVHLGFATLPQALLFTGDPGFNFIWQVGDAEDMLMRGFTSVRDMGGSVFGLKQAIDEGRVVGPRIYPSGSLISQTAGHGDFRFPNQDNPEFGGPQPYWLGLNYVRIVDGVPRMLTAARENLKHGASQIKLAAGGGYSSPADPLMGNQYTFEEIKAACDTAADWGTYVTIHAYHPAAIERAIDAGVKDIGHGQLLDEKLLKRMAKEGVFLSTQPFTVCNEPQLDDFSNAKLAEVCKGTAFVYQAAKDIPKLKITYGTDLFFVSQEVYDEQAKMMERLLKWYEPVEILRMATSTSGELFEMSGLRNPYTEGPLGVVKEGAYADLLLVDGNPLADLSVVTDKDNIKVIMKDGVIFKNTLE